DRSGGAEAGHTEGSRPTSRSRDQQPDIARVPTVVRRSPPCARPPLKQVRRAGRGSHRTHRTHGSYGTYGIYRATCRVHGRGNSFGKSLCRSLVASSMPLCRSLPASSTPLCNSLPASSSPLWRSPPRPFMPSNSAPPTLAPSSQSASRSPDRRFLLVFGLLL